MIRALKWVEILRTQTPHSWVNGYQLSILTSVMNAAGTPVYPVLPHDMLGTGEHHDLGVALISPNLFPERRGSLSLIRQNSKIVLNSLRDNTQASTG